MKFYLVIAGLGVMTLSSCNLFKKTQTVEPVTVVDSVKVEEPPVSVTREVYRAAETREFDLLHTNLDVSFDWDKQYLHGKAFLTLTPYFYPTKTLNLDAKGFDIKKVELVEGEIRTGMEYEYDDLVLSITLDKKYYQGQEVKVYIEYTAKPEELEAGGSAAITSDKGLYFINPKNEDKNKPQQIWTQGETEASSCWFPTIDAPNERMTQEIAITVDEKYLTLSNGTLSFSSLNGDGTRTDYWKQEKPHAPYLVMMAVGEFSVTKDQWKEMEVNYYVEDHYADHASAIFGETPEMIELFSNQLGVPYPWDKYHQIVVRDYVSGAMENTSAVIHGEFLYQTKRELLDSDNEDIIAHELYHHWFGDLVTCESWANLPLNESFATYGEYLWREHKHGRESADAHLYGMLNQYLSESKSKQVDMIRFDYEDKEDMFDRHSYSKGGRILHMLRKEVGDKAFFASLKKYLEDNRYQAVEIHHLRLAFEEVTGRDLNWFFDQWFLSSGHPEIEISYEYDGEAGQQTVTVLQKQNLEKTPLYHVPLLVDIYIDGKPTRYHKVLDETIETWTFEVSKKPDWVNVDAEKMLLCQKKDQKEQSEWIAQYQQGPLFLDRYEALNKCIKKSRKDQASAEVVVAALDDPYWGLRRAAAGGLKGAVNHFPERIQDKLLQLAGSDPSAKVRSSALSALTKHFESDDLMPVYEQALKDSSYAVIGRGLRGMVALDKERGMKEAARFESENAESILVGLANLYGKNGGKEKHQFFIDINPKITGFNRIGYISSYTTFLSNNTDDKTVDQALPMLEEMVGGSGAWWMKTFPIKALESIQGRYSSQEHDLQEEITKKEAIEGADLSEITILQNDLNRVKTQKAKVEKVIQNIRNNEKDKRVLRLLD